MVQGMRLELMVLLTINHVKMEKTILPYLFFFCLAGCTGFKKITGNYKSSCFLQLYPNVILNVNSDSTFEYRFAYLEEVIKGKWKVSNDTLFLYSERFQQINVNELSPRIKYTDLPGYDGYLIRKKKLYVLTPNKIMEDECYLIKQ